MIPVLIMMLAGWVWTVEGKITRMETKLQQDEAQWKVLYENRKMLDQLKINVELYKKLFVILKDERKGKWLKPSSELPKLKQNDLPLSKKYSIDDFKLVTFEDITQDLIKRIMIENNSNIKGRR